MSSQKSKKQDEVQIQKLKEDLQVATAAKEKMEESLAKVAQLLKGRFGEEIEQDKIPEKVEDLLAKLKEKEDKMDEFKKMMQDLEWFKSGPAAGTRKRRSNCGSRNDK